VRVNPCARGARDSCFHQITLRRNCIMQYIPTVTYPTVTRHTPTYLHVTFIRQLILLHLYLLHVSYSDACCISTAHSVLIRTISRCIHVHCDANRRAPQRDLSCRFGSSTSSTAVDGSAERSWVLLVGQALIFGNRGHHRVLEFLRVGSGCSTLGRLALHVSCFC